jgi:hypothetical protein
MIEEINASAKTVTRRAVVGGGLSCLLACFASKTLLAEFAASGSGLFENAGHFRGPELFAFPGAQGKTTVLAAIWPARPGTPGNSQKLSAEVLIHTGPKSWTVKVADAAGRPHVWTENASRIFAGSISPSGRSSGERMEAVVIETPSHALGGGRSLEIWAERSGQDGTRQRVGTPFLAEILAQDSALADIYHSTSPLDDRASLTSGVAAIIAARARKAGHARDPEAYARRIAAVLLPDVLRYDPSQPAGFTFAAQNGRRPDEKTAGVVSTILSGTMTRSASLPGIAVQESFPYLSPRQVAL